MHNAVLLCILTRRGQIMATKREVFLWESVTDTLAKQIRSGVFADSGRFLSIDQISQEFGVSNITSRKVVSELAKIGLIEKGRGKGCWLKQKPINAEIFITGGYDEDVAKTFSNYIFSEVIKGMTRYGIPHGFTLTVVEPLFLRSLIDSRWRKEKINVIILQCEIKDSELMAFLASPASNTVICRPPVSMAGFVSVREDLAKGAKIAVSHMVSKGRRKIAFLTAKGIWYQSRFEGYYSGLKESDLLFDLSLVKEVSIIDYAHCAEAVDEYIDASEQPDAIIAATDFMAMHAIRRLRERGLKVPDDIPVIGFDNRPEGAIFDVPLTTIDIQLPQQGYHSVRLIEKMLLDDGEPEDFVVEPLLIQRHSA